VWGEGISIFEGGGGMYIVCIYCTIKDVVHRHILHIYSVCQCGITYSTVYSGCPCGISCSTVQYMNTVD
jgi:hypothetical protein